MCVHRDREIRSGELALPAGTVLSPAAIGFLSGIGVTEASVYSPSVAIIITGNERSISRQSAAVMDRCMNQTHRHLLLHFAGLNVPDVQVTHAKIILMK